MKKLYLIASFGYPMRISEFGALAQLIANNIL